MSTPSLPPIDPERAISYKFPESVFSYTERDVALYALGVGTCGREAVDEKELQYVYHRDGQKFIKVLPTFGSVFSFRNRQGVEDVEGLHFDPSLLLHGQHYLEIYKPFPSNCCVRNELVIAGLHDKGKAAIVEVQTTSYDKDSGEALCMTRNAIYLRGSGGFSKSSTPYSYTNYPPSQISPITIPKHKPSAVFEDCTQPSQALIYRLSGDYNPLHSDPEIARSFAGFSRPILHGLCTLGFAVRAIVKSFCNGEATIVKSVFGRFLLHVYPGETLVTEMWLQSTKVVFQTKVKERNRAVLSGYVLLEHIPSSL